VIAGRVLNRLAGRTGAAKEATAAVVPTPARVAGRAVRLIPHYSETLDESALSGGHRGIRRSCEQPAAPSRLGQWARSGDLRWRCEGNRSRCGRS
jgi:hypothetical protein